MVTPGVMEREVFAVAAIARVVTKNGFCGFNVGYRGDETTRA